MEVFNSLKRTLTGTTAEAEREKKMTTLRQRAEKRAIDDYNIVRLDGIDYITHYGIPVSVPEDAQNGSMCDRLETYRQNYVNACLAADKVIGDTNPY